MSRDGLLPYSDDGTGKPVNKKWTANIKKYFTGIGSEHITTNGELADYLIEQFNHYAAIYNLDPNILAAQAYAESKFNMWIYNDTISTASGLCQFVMNTTYGLIVDNLSLFWLYL